MGSTLLTATAWAALLAGTLGEPATGAVPAARTYNVRAFGAVGDGVILDTAAINQAVAECSAEGGGRVLLPPGKYLSGTVHLKSGVELYLEEGATLIGTPDLDRYETFTAAGGPPALRPSRWSRGLILAQDAHDIAIAGKGTIDGRHVFDPQGEEKMRGPHAILLGRCRNVTLRDVHLANAGNYAFLFFVSDQVTVENVTFTGGWDGVHFRGSTERWCSDVRISHCRFYTGDDCIAGSYWRNVVISDCVINSSCNGIRLIGPARDTQIARCEMYGPGQYEHRTSRALHRTNMLAGLCLQPSAWEPMPGPMEDVRISDITMKNVTTPLHLVTRPGNPAGRITIERLKAEGAYRTACSIESWGEKPFAEVLLRDVEVEFTAAGTEEDARLPVRMPGVDARKLPVWGLYARGVERLVLRNVRFAHPGDDARPMLLANGVQHLTLEHCRFERKDPAPDLMTMTQVVGVDARDSTVARIEPRCTDLVLLAPEADGRFHAGKPFAAEVSVANGAREGLGKVELSLAGRRVDRWVWLRAEEKRAVRFEDLTAPAAGDYPVRCGGVAESLRVEP